MTRKTSAEAYEQIKRDGLLKKLKLQIYAALYAAGPMTQSQCWDYIVRTSGQGTQLRSATPRFAELEQLGVIETVGEAKDTTVTHSGKQNMLWDVTGRLPIKLPRKQSLKQQLAIEKAITAELLGALVIMGQAAGTAEMATRKASEDANVQLQEIAARLTVLRNPPAKPAKKRSKPNREADLFAISGDPANQPKNEQAETSVAS